MINIYEYLLSKSNKNINTNYEIFPSKKYADAIEAAELIYNEMKDVFPKLNNFWKKYFIETFNEPFETEKQYAEYYKKCCENSLIDYRGHKSKWGDYWVNGIYSDNDSCLGDDYKSTINQLNKKQPHDEPDFHVNENVILYSTCCRILEHAGWDNPITEWTAKNFRMADLGMQIAFRKIIYEKQ